MARSTTSPSCSWCRRRAVAGARLDPALTARLRVPAPVVFLIAAAAISDILPRALGAGVDPRRRADRRGRADRDPVRRRHAGRLAAAARRRFGRSSLLGRRRHVPDGGAGARRRPDHPARVLDDGRDHRRRARPDRSGGDVLGAGPARHRRPVPTILEGEAGANDPVAIALVVGLLAYASPGASALARRRRLRARDGRSARPSGAVGAFVLVRAMRRDPLPREGLNPLRTLAARRPDLRRGDAAARLGLPGGVRRRRAGSATRACRSRARSSASTPRSRRWARSSSSRPSA